jgi:hypothetical protein
VGTRRRIHYEDSHHTGDGAVRPDQLPAAGATVAIVQPIDEPIEQSRRAADQRAVCAARERSGVAADQSFGRFFEFIGKPADICWI